MHCRSIRVSLVVLPLYVAIQLLWTPNCFGAADIPEHLDGIQETVARWPSATVANGNVLHKTSFDDEVQEHFFHSRRLSQRRSTEQLRGDGFSCSLNETELGAVYNQTARIWLIDDGVLSSFNNNIQAIINCTTENDTVFFRTESTVRPQTTITIPWNLTLSGFIEDDPTGGDGVPEANRKVTFACPENGQLMVARTSSFVLANVAVIGCNSSSDIILLEPRCADELESNTRSHFAHVDFARNTLWQNGSLLNATQSSCTQLVLEDVKFNRNRCNGQGCVLITTNAELHGIRAVRNGNSSDSPEECSFFSIQDASEVAVANVSALRNEIRVLRIHNSSVGIRDSRFERNNRTQMSTSATFESGGGALFANQSTVSIEGSTFQNNTALSGSALYVVLTGLNVSNCTFFQNNATTFTGGAIDSRLGRFFSLTSSNFSENVAWEGGALAAENTSVSLMDCQFLRNNASNSGACSFRGNSSIDIVGSLFHGNRANGAFAGAMAVSEDIMIEIRNSTFRNNEAIRNGGAVSIATRCQSLLIDVLFTSNTAGGNGGAIATHTFTQVEVVRSNFTGNQASRGGAIFARFNSTLSISIPRSNTNEAEHGAAATVDFAGNNRNFETFFEQNSAELEGGAIDLSDNGTLLISNASFERNTAVLDGGAIRILTNSSLYVSNTSLRRNRGNYGGALHASDRCNVEIFSCEIRGNTADLFGGGISFENNTAGIVSSSFITGNKAQLGGGVACERNSTLTLVESRLVRSAASVGGCLYMRASNASISSSLFRNSRAELEGGAVFMYLQSNLSAWNLTFIRNEARTGGAIRMNTNCMASLNGSTFRDNNANTDGGALSMNENCSALVNSSIFRDNTARNGGAVGLESGNLTVWDTHVISNEVSKNGGGVHISESSFLNATGLSLSSNSANRRGGGVCLLTGSSFLCYACLFEDNTASNGAGIYGRSNSRRNFIRAQLQDCTLARNSALLSGGGLQFDSPEDRGNTCFQEGVSCGSIVLLNSSFVDNSAFQSGAAILLSDPENVLVSSTFIEGRQDSFLNITNNSLLSPVNHQGQYNSWTGNRVLTEDAGGVVGTYGRSLSFSVNSSSGFRIIKDEESVFWLEDIQSGQQLPTIRITVLDAFGNGPAPTIPPAFNTSIMSPDRLFQGVVTGQITNGTGTFPGISALRQPREYALKIIPQSVLSIEEATMMVKIRACQIGEEPMREIVLCQECGDSAYNFDPATPNSCKSCPEHATCEGRYIAPVDGYWHKGPCHDNITQCIKEDACTYDERDEKLYTFSEKFIDCDMSETALLSYSELLCRTGYEGPLCGSCTQTYGLSIGYECSECPHPMESVLTLVLLVCYLLLISSFTLRGGLPYQAKHISSIGGQSSRSTVVWNSTRSVAINLQMVEMMRDGYVPPEVLQRPRNTRRPTPSPQQRNKAEMASWKTSEIFKITINFLQVTAAAAGIAVHWTDGIMAMFKASEYVGALTTVAIFRPIDCLFPSSSAVVRSVWRTMFGLFVPGVVIAIFIAYWALTKKCKKKPMSFFWKRSILSLMAVVYISYLGLTKLAVRSFYCVEVVDSENHVSATRTSYWAVDTAIRCYGREHSALITIGVIVLTLVTLSFPMVSAFIITRHKEQQEVPDSWTNETMGFLYRAFRKSFVYWESVVMLRKACLSVIVVFAYPLGGQLQTTLALLLLMFSLSLQNLCKPYRQELNVLNHYEYLSLFVSCVTLTLGQFLDSDRCSSFVKGSVAFMIVFINMVTFLVLLLACLSSGVDHLRAVLEDEGVHVPDDLRWWSVLKMVLITKMSQLCDSAN